MNDQEPAPPIGHVVWRIGLMLCGTIWWGGLSFYAMVVVPIGSDVIGSTQQGFITQRVTQWHNAISCLFMVLLLVEAYRRRSLALSLCGLLLLASNVGLIVWHRRLTSLMFQSPSIPETFYDQHAVYLWITTIEWGIGLLTLCLLFMDSVSDITRQSDRSRDR